MNDRRGDRRRRTFLGDREERPFLRRQEAVSGPPGPGSEGHGLVNVRRELLNRNEELNYRRRRSRRETWKEIGTGRRDWAWQDPFPVGYEDTANKHRGEAIFQGRNKGRCPGRLSTGAKKKR